MSAESGVGLRGFSVVDIRSCGFPRHAGLVRLGYLFARAKLNRSKTNMKNWSNYLITALIAVGAVYLYNTFVAPKAGLPTA